MSESIFQNFDFLSTPATVHKRLSDLRNSMIEAKIDVFLVPHADEYQNEYLPPECERLSWITSFTGSAGFAIIFIDKALLFVDGRYTLQAASQTDLKYFVIKDLHKISPISWLAGNLSSGSTVGFDPHLLTIHQHQELKLKLKKTGSELKPVKNLIDQIWHEKPEKTCHPAIVLEQSHTGQSAADKIAGLAKNIENNQADLCLLTEPASINWLFNIRGSDVAHTPLVLSRCIAQKTGKPMLFIDENKLDYHTVSYLNDLAEIYSESEITEKLIPLVKDSVVWVDPNHVSEFFGNLILTHGGNLLNLRNPLVLPCAVKNEQEIKGSRNAHLYDGVAMVKFLNWLDLQPSGTISEISAAIKLEKIRIETALKMGTELKEVAFDTISAAGEHSALCHYRVNYKTNKILKDGSLYLIDSGGQYIEGTTDITRTVTIGIPPQGAIEDFTSVLKGNIAISMLRFPPGARGVDLDAFARIALWKRGRDYSHGTGHGVGSYLNVHEGPQSISKNGLEILKPGMIISNEPGYYLEGSYGIRIENLLLVHEARPVDNGHIPMLGFENLTLAPIEYRLIALSLLSDDELNWLNAYHSHVKNTLMPHLEEKEKKWLSNACRVLSR